jgi:uncharacterized protein
MNTEKPITLVVGASKNPERYSYKAIRSLISNGYPVFAYGLRNEIVDGIEIQTDLDFKEAIHTVTMYVGPDRQAEIIPKLLELKPEKDHLSIREQKILLFIQQAINNKASKPN